MSLDSPVRGENSSDPNAGCLAGSQALDSLDKLVTSTESYFHPSNAGHWTVAVRPVWCRVILWANTRIQLTSFLHRLTVEFCKRWKEEELQTCKTPIVSCMHLRRLLC